MIIHLTLLLFRHNKQTQYNHKDSPIGIGSLLYRSCQGRWWYIDQEKAKTYLIRDLKQFFCFKTIFICFKPDTQFDWTHCGLFKCSPKSRGQSIYIWNDINFILSIWAIFFVFPLLWHHIFKNVVISLRLNVKITRLPQKIIQTAQ